MALMRTDKFDEIPKGAVKLSKEEAISFQLDIVRDWPNFWES